MRGLRVGIGALDPPQNHKAIGMLSNTDLDPLENHKTTTPAFKAGPISARNLKAI